MSDVENQNNIPRITLLTAQILDAMIAINNGDLPLVRLNGKVPIDKNWQNGGCKTEDALVHTGNLGIVLGEFESDNGRTHWVVYDLDFEPKVAESLCKTLMRKLGDYCIVVKTASGKYHLWFRVDGYMEMKTHELFGGYQFPYDIEFEEYRNQPLGEKGEVFEGLRKPNRQMGAAGNAIDGSFYEVADFSKHNKIYYLPIISAKDLKDKTEFALLDAGYTTYTPLDSETIEKESNVGFISNSNRQVIPSYKIDKFADFIIDIMKHNDGSKHYITLALGNYLSTYVDKNSSIKLSEKIIEKEPTLFKSNDDFQRTLLKEYGDD